MAWTDVLSAASLVLFWTAWILFPLLYLPLAYFGLSLFLRPRSLLENLVEGLAAAADAFNAAIGEAARWLAVVMVIVYAATVFLRYVFAFAHPLLDDSVLYAHVALFALSVGVTLLHDGHVRVDVLYANRSPRGRAATDFVGVYLFLIPMALILLLASRKFVGSSWATLEASPTGGGLPGWYLIKTMIGFISVALLSQGVSMAARAAMTLTGAREADPPHAHDIHEAL